MRGFQNKINENFLGKCKFANSSTAFEEGFHPLVGKNTVKNNYKMRKHMLITGPNASGKTTFLKMTMINVILSQQIGYGCYKQAVLNPYDCIHSYINIPDTSDRDSLFQAEARRCLNILEKKIQKKVKTSLYI